MSKESSAGTHTQWEREGIQEISAYQIEPETVKETHSAVATTGRRQHGVHSI